MNSESPKRLVLNDNKLRDILTTHNHIAQNENSNRRTSIRLKDLSSGKKEHQFLEKLKMTNSPLSIGVMKGSSKLIKQKSQQLLKTETLTQKKISARELDAQNNLKEGDTYKQISPKVIINNDKINVYFVKEINKYHITNETKPPKLENITTTENTLQMQEISQQRVYLKGPQQTQQTSNRQHNTSSIINIPKSGLSNHQTLLQASAKKLLKKQNN